MKTLVVSPSELGLITSKEVLNRLLKNKNINIVKDSPECYDAFGYIFFEWIEVSEKVFKSI